MATVTVYTAARMQEIEDGSIIDGVVDGSGNLILETKDGTFINAGPVVAAAGTPFVGQYTTAGRPAATGLAGKIYWDITLESFYLSSGSTWSELAMGGIGDPAEFVGQFATVDRPTAASMTNKIIWDTTTEDFYLSNGTIWTVLSIGISDPYVGQYTTALRPTAVGKTDQILWDTTAQAFYKSNGTTWVAVSRELLSGTNMDVDESVPGYSTINTVASPTFDDLVVTDSISCDDSTARIAGVGKTPSGGTNKQFEIYGTGPGVDCFGTGSVPASPIATVNNTAIGRFSAHGYTDTLAATASDNRMEVQASEDFDVIGQGQRWRWFCKANGSTAAVQTMILDHNGALLLNRPAIFGYAAGAGGAVTQITSRSTAVTIDKPCGRIILFQEQMTSLALRTFIVNNSLVTSFDAVIVTLSGIGSTQGYYRIWVDECTTGMFNLSIQNYNGSSSPDESPCITFAIIKAYNA